MYWCTGALVYWCTGVLMYWCTGVLVYWCPGALVHWCLGEMPTCRTDPEAEIDLQLSEEEFQEVCDVLLEKISMLETLWLRAPGQFWTRFLTKVNIG